MLPVHLKVLGRAAMKAATIARALGGHRSGHSWTCRCPAHVDDTPSLSITDNGKRVLFYCHAGCTYVSIVKALRAAGLWDRPGQPAQPASAPSATSAVEDPPKPPRDPLQSWRAGDSIRNTLAEAYLDRRGLQLTDAEAQSLRFHPSLWHWPSRTWRPAMLALVKLASGVELTTHQTFLADDGSGKADVDKPRLFPAGTSPTGGGVWFGIADPLAEFIVAEGVETTLSALRLLNAPAGCGALSALGVRKLLLPPEARRVRIFCDRDPADQSLKAARVACARWRREDREVRVTWPTHIGEDANDILVRRLAHG
jgi:putative DNA primase/helicase